ncbi:Glycosyltransferase involved in cell wall bisynthesis [Lachnospiraceae bacterium G11]|nr:Glycosyltransferase involved in cell wall bisynthesis [Lachnospiraceae bacterium G11]
MKVLWIVNTMLPVISHCLGVESSVKEGWITGMFAQIMANTAGNGIELHVAFPAKDELANFEGEIPVEDLKLPNIPFGISTENLNFKAYGFYEDVSRPEKYDIKTEESIRNVINKVAPDVIHVFGTEYPHCLATLKASEYSPKVLIGLQGLCHAIAGVYEANLPAEIVRRNTFRDFIKRDSIKNQKKKFTKRGINEIEAIKAATYITGRTSWDRKIAKEINPEVIYLGMNETLRSPFYTGRWRQENCEPGVIFLSQGDYPLKGLHYVLESMPKILEECPNAHIYIGGQNITKHETFKEKLKLSSYGKYLLKLIKVNHLEDKVTFLGSLTAEEMREQYLRSNVFVCPSKLENSPNSLGEAMLLGVPCVAARVGGIPDLITEDEGILYEDGNVDELANAIIEQLKAEGDFTARLKKARGHANFNHDPEANYHTLLQIYNRIAN